MAKIIGTAIAPIDDLNYFEGNAKKHDIGKIIESIVLHGFFQTLLVDKRIDQVLGGNGRLESLVWLQQNPSDAENIAKELKARYKLSDEVIVYPPAGITLTEKGRWQVNVLEIETVNDAEAIAINLQDNFSVLDGGDFTLLDKSRAFEVDALLEQLEALKEANFLPVSVDNDDLDLLLKELEERNDDEWEETEEDEDELNDILDDVGKDESRVKLGEIWQLGRHKIACGDSTLESNVRALLGGDFGNVGIVFTDPPYNVAYEGKTEEKLVIQNDAFNSSSEFYEFLLSYFSACCAASRAGAAIYVCHADIEGENFRRALRAGGWLYKQSLVWVKQSLVLGRQDYHWKHEPILYGWKGGAAHNWYADRSQTTVWNFDRPTVSREHPTMKPLDLVEYALGNSSNETDIVFDGFLGSGTTLLAAQKMEGDRTVYGFELSPDYCEVIIKRYEQFTGDVAKLVGTLPNN